MNQTILNAIVKKQIISFSYRGHDRIAEPHVYGSKDGVEQVLVYQVGGSSSSGGLPEWRRVDVQLMTNLALTGQEFPGPRPTTTGNHSAWDVTYAIVK